MSRPSPRVPLTSKEVWLSDGRQVLPFLPTHWERIYQRLEINGGERIPGEQVPLLKNRREISRDEELKLWATQAPGWLEPLSAPVVMVWTRSEVCRTDGFLKHQPECPRIIQLRAVTTNGTRSPMPSAA